MTTELLAAIGLCGALLAACSQKTERTADAARLMVDSVNA